MTEEAVTEPQPTITPPAEISAVAPTTTVEPTAPVQTTTEFDLTKYIDPKTGNFMPGWKEGLLDERHRQSKFFDSGIKDIRGLLSIAGNQSQLIGKKTIAPIHDKSTTAEIEEYRRAMGITGEYRYEPPKDITLIDMSLEGMKPFFAELDKAHYTQKQFDAGMKVYTESIRNLEQAIEDNEKAELDEAERIINKEYGNETDYDNALHLATRVIDETTINWKLEKTAKFIEAINESPLKPYVMDFIKTVGAKFTEHKIITDLETSMGAADIEAKIHEEMQTPAYQTRDDPGHKLKVAQVQSLFQEKERRKAGQPQGPV